MTDQHMPSKETLARLQAYAPDGPAVFLNLLCYRKPGGREAFARYGQISGPLITAAQGRVIFGGKAGPVISGSDVEWDDVLLVRFPSVDHFLGMIESEIYTQQAAPIRAEALEATLWMAIDPFPAFGGE